MRTWPGLAAIGAGLILLGTAAGSSPAALVLLAVCGAAEVAWGAGALALPAPPRPRAALGGASALVVLWLAVLVLPLLAHHAQVPLAPQPLAGAALLDLATAATLAVRLRRPRPPAEGGPLRFLLTAGVGAGAVAVLTTWSLAGAAPGAGMPMH